MMRGGVQSNLFAAEDSDSHHLVELKARNAVKALQLTNLCAYLLVLSDVTF